MILVTGAVRCARRDLRRSSPALPGARPPLARRAWLPSRTTYTSIAKNSSTLVFLERWVDRAALRAHFAVPASREFVRALAALVAAPPTLDIYETTKLERP